MLISDMTSDMNQGIYITYMCKTLGTSQYFIDQFMYLDITNQKALTPAKHPYEY